MSSNGVQMSDVRQETPVDGIRIETNGHPGCLRLIGELDMSNTEHLDRALARALSLGGEVILDMSRLDFIDSSGLHVIIRHAVAMDEGSVIVLRDPSVTVRKILEVTGADRLPQLRVDEHG
jgi:anti-anti-sigma factor